VAHNIPTTTHELHLVIPNDYQTRCFDFGRQNLDGANLGSSSGGRILDFRTGSNATAANAGQVYLRIEGIEFFAGMAMGPRADDAKFCLDMREYRMIPYSIPEAMTPHPNTYPFNLSSTTASVSVAFQSAKAGNGTTSLSKFVVPTQVASRGAETALQRFYVTFANQNRPREENESFLSYRGFSTDQITPSFDHKDQPVQYFTQRYMETMINAGQLFRAGGCESFEEWLERGAYFNWVWPRDGADLSTRFHVNVAFMTDKIDETDPSAAYAHRLLQRGWPSKIKRGVPATVTYAATTGVPTTVAAAETELTNDINILIFDMVPKAYMIAIQNGRVVGSETASVMVSDGARRVRTGGFAAPAA
jgi:hypothetical protein